jgi:bla regulator protein blaR1
MKKVALSVALATVTLAQTPSADKRAEFEVASVKPTATQDGSLAVSFPPGGRFSVRNLTVKQLLQNAYAKQDYQISGGPGWLTSAGFDIEARASAQAAEVPREQVLRMIQTLLADRFHLTLHRETRQLPVYALVVGKTGPRLQPAASNAGRSRTMMGQLIVQKMSMTALADILALDLKLPVNDETGLQGEFAFTLEWTRGLSESDDGPSSKPSLFTAVQEQLGLKLQSTRGPVQVLVIDSAEKPSGN